MSLEMTPSDYSIMVCDDEESIRNLLRTAISDWQFRVDTFPGGAEALQSIQQGNVPNILLTDIHMGTMTGIELAGKVKKIAPDVEIIIMTATSTFETAIQAMRIGVFDYLGKPFEDVEDVRKTLFHVCERINLLRQNQHLVGELRRRNDEIASLAHMSSELAKNSDLKKVVQIGCKGLSSGFGGCPVIFFQYDPARRALVGAARHATGLFGDVPPLLPVPEEAARSKDSLTKLFRNLPSMPDFARQLRQAEASKPGGPNSRRQWRSLEFQTRDVHRGAFVLHVERWEEPESHHLAERYLHTLSTAFENAVSHAQLVKSSVVDDLTGLFNVRYLNARLEEEVRRASRLQHPLSVLFCDVDHFKKYNDTHGHPAGDRVLKILSRLMRTSFRETDVCARYGGEEFCIVMPDTSVENAARTAERFRAQVEATKFPDEETQPLGVLSISVGVAEYPRHEGTARSLLKVADLALYEAKRKSRNRVVVGTAPAGYVPPFEAKTVRSARTGRKGVAKEPVGKH